MTYRRSGQYNLVRLGIVTNSETPIELDVSGTFIDATIYESIFSQTISGSVTIVDSQNIIQRYGLGNGESVFIEWQTEGVSDTRIVSGTVYDVTGPAKVSGHSEAFTLHFASDEFINSVRTKMFNGFKGTTSDIVVSIVNSIKRNPSRFTFKPIYTTPTKNIEHIVMSGQSPFEAIQMCANRSVSTANDVGFLFYEDLEQFNFRPIQELYQQEPVIEYVHKDLPSYNNVKNAHEESFNTIQHFQLIDNNKFLNDLMDGQYGSSWGYLSLYDKSLNIYTYNNKTNNSESKSLGRSQSLVSRNYSTSNLDKLNIVYSLDHEQNEPYAHMNMMALLNASTIAYNIGVFGNSAIKVGSTCIATIPVNASLSGTEPDFDNISGKFLISEIKHMLMPSQYNQVIQIVKDSYEDAIQ